MSTIALGQSTYASPSSGQPLSFSQLEQLWIQAGGSAAWAPTMAAVAMVESGGNPQAANESDINGGSYGLWQINGSHAGVISGLPPSQGGPAPSQAWIGDMSNPMANARQAVALLGSGGGIGNWGGDPVGGAVVANGGVPLTAAQAQQAAAAGGGSAVLAAANRGCPQIIGFSLPLVGQVNILNECQARGLLGGLLLAAGGLVMVVGGAAIGVTAFESKVAARIVQGTQKTAGAFGAPGRAASRGAGRFAAGSVPAPAAVDTAVAGVAS